VAGKGGGEVSMTWGFSEASGKTAFDSLFTPKGVVCFAATGDSPGALYRSASSNVVAVGGTSLVRNPLPWRGNLGDFQGEVVWNWGPTEGTGGGPSLYEPRPPYQYPVKDIVGSSRGTPDVAAVALPACGSMTRTFRVGSSSVEPAFPLRYGRASSTRVASTTPRRPNSSKSMPAHPCSKKLPEGSRTSLPVRAVSDPTSRAFWPPKAGNSAPGWQPARLLRQVSLAKVTCGQIRGRTGTIKSSVSSIREVLALLRGLTLQPPDACAAGGL
jgi:hypothetical protein